MAETWCAGKAGYSSAKLARLQIGLEAFQPDETAKRPNKSKSKAVPDKGDAASNSESKPESKAKRLERRFEELKRSGVALAISVYRQHNAARSRAVSEVHGAVSIGPYYTAHRDKADFSAADENALRRAALSCGITLDDARRLSGQGLAILKEWLPHEYPPERI